MNKEEFKELCLNAGFSEEQFFVLERGVQHGLDIKVYAKKDFGPGCMEQALLGLLHHVDVGKYVKKDLDAVQMRYLRLLLEKHLFVQKYASGAYSGEQLEQLWLAASSDESDLAVIDDSEYSAEKMYQLRSIIKNLRERGGENISDIVSLYGKMNEYQLYWINCGLLNNLDVSIYSTDEYSDGQMEQLYLGMLHNLNIGTYKDRNLSAEQMREIRLGEAEGVNTSIYAKCDYTYLQMRELRIAQQMHLDVTAYADQRLDHRVMRLARLGQQDGIDITGYTDPTMSYEDAKVVYEDLMSAQSGIINGNEGYNLSSGYVSMLGLEMPIPGNTQLLDEELNILHNTLVSTG